MKLKKIVLIPDSFKGTMSSADICALMREQIEKHYPEAEIVSIPVADGGEGSVDCFLKALGGEKVDLRVKGPAGEPVDAFYGLLDGGRTAVVEMAAAAGLPLLEGRRDPLGATTYGVGELILDAARRGAKKIIVGLGGSATNDGGCGAAAAVGVRFLDEAGNEFVPAGGTLRRIARIDSSRKSPLLGGVTFVAMCDIDSPMYGPQGAAHIFGPQKGATPEDIEVIDAGLRNLARVIHEDLGPALDTVPGTGAAGAMGAGMIAFFGAKLEMGIQTVLSTVKFDTLLEGAGLVLTGEGKIDGQSLRGKVVVGVARRAKVKGVPVVAIVGDIGDDVGAVYGEGVSGIFSINRVAKDFEVVRTRSRDDLSLTVDNLMHFISCL